MWSYMSDEESIMETIVPEFRSFGKNCRLSDNTWPVEIVTSAFPFNQFNY